MKKSFWLVHEKAVSFVALYITKSETLIYDQIAIVLALWEHNMGLYYLILSWNNIFFLITTLVLIGACVKYCFNFFKKPVNL